MCPLYSAQLGAVTGVRLVKNKMGHSKGYAYVEFESEVSELATQLNPKPSRTQREPIPNPTRTQPE